MPASTTDSRRAPMLLVLLVFAAALAIRLVNLSIIDTNPYYAAPVMDEQHHQDWASRIVEGHGREYLPFYRAPGYPYALASLYRVTGPGIPAGRALGAVLGALTVVLTLLLGWRLGGRGVGLLAAGVLAIYPMALYYDGMLLGASLETLWVVGAVLLLVVAVGRDARIPRTRSVAGIWTLVLLGAVLGLGTVTRPLIALLLPVTLVFLYRGSGRRDVGGRDGERRDGGRRDGGGHDGGGRDGGRPWARMLLVAALWAAPVIGVTAANGIVGGDAVLIAWNGGINFFLGNNPDANGWSATAPELRPSWWTGYADAIEIASRDLGHPASPSEVSRYWYGRGLRFVVSQPAAWLALLGRKVYLLVNTTEVSNNQSIAAFRQYSPLLRTPLLGFALVLALAMPRLVRRRTWREPLPWCVAVYGLAIVAFFVTSRYRMPLVPLILVLASCTVVDLAGHLRRCAWRDVARIAVITAGVLLLTGSDWAGIHRPDPADRHFSLGNRHFEAGDMESAIAAYERALAATQGVTTEVQLQALNNIASARLNQGRSREAREAAARSLRLRPTPEAHARLGWAYFQEGRNDSARVALGRSLALNAANPEALYYLGHVERVAGELGTALATWERALASHPDPGLEQLLRYALATFYVQAGGDPGRALHHLDRITRSFPDLDRLRAASEAALHER